MQAELHNHAREGGQPNAFAVVSDKKKTGLDWSPGLQG